MPKGLQQAGISESMIFINFNNLMKSKMLNQSIFTLVNPQDGNLAFKFMLLFINDNKNLSGIPTLAGHTLLR